MEARASGAAPETREAPRTNITVLVSTLRLGFCGAQYFEYLQASICTWMPRGLAEAAQPGSTTQPKSENHLLRLAVITFLGGIFYIQVSCHFSVIH